LRNRIAPFVTLPNPALNLSDRKARRREPAGFDFVGNQTMPILLRPTEARMSGRIFIPARMGTGYQGEKWEPSHAHRGYPHSTRQGSLAMLTLEMGGLIVLGIIALDVVLGFALERWHIDL
jgi:hypothetical protein